EDHQEARLLARSEGPVLRRLERLEERDLPQRQVLDAAWCRAAEDDLTLLLRPRDPALDLHAAHRDAGVVDRGARDDEHQPVALLAWKDPAAVRQLDGRGA